MSHRDEAVRAQCPICGYETASAAPADRGLVRGNTQRFCDTLFPLWKCPRCATIVSLDPVDLADIYRDYPLNERRMDAFAEGTLGNLLHRLDAAGLASADAVLDYGCGNGLFVEFLRQRGYQAATGYDPFVPEYAEPPSSRAPYDAIVNNDVLEHSDTPRDMIRECLQLLKPGGLLYVGTTDSAPVDMANLEPEVMRLHQPFHRVLITEKALQELVCEFEVDLVATYSRSYLDTRRPFANYRFLNEINKAVGHRMDLALDPRASTRAFLKSPRIWFYALFGYWFPVAIEPAVVVRKR